MLKKNKYDYFVEGTLVVHKSNMLRNNQGFGIVLGWHENLVTVLFPKIEKRYHIHHRQLIIMPPKSMRTDWTEKKRNQRGKKIK